MRGRKAGAPCGCHSHTGGDDTLAEMSTMQEGAWQNVLLGADVPGMKARGTIVPNGPFLHAFLKFRLPHDPKVYMVQAHIDLREVEKAINAELAARPEAQAAVVGGKIWRKMKKGVKKAVKTIAKNKIVRGVISVAKKAFNNPLIKAALSATPFGAAITATAAAARVAAKAIKGGMKAKKVLSSIAQRAKRGDPDAIKAARIVKKGMELTGVRPQLTLAAQQQAAAAGEPEYLAAVVGSCVNCAPAHYAMPQVVGCGADEGDAEDHEVEALEEFATSGAFEGVRWLASRLAPHSMFGAGPNFTKRDALQLGMSLYTQPRA